MRLALDDIRSGLFGTGVWLHLAWHEIRMRYKRSVIGPFWITISTGVMVGALGPLYGTLLNQDLSTYFQHLAISMILWAFLSGSVNESCTAFIVASGFIKEIRLPLSVHVLRVLAKNAIMFLHNCVIILLVLIVFPPSDARMLFLAIPGLILLIGNLMWIGLGIALLSARFRDIPQIVGNVLQVAFFVTPIVWKREMLGDNSYVTLLNPLFHLINVVQAPLLGQRPLLISWVACACMLLVGGGLVILMFARVRNRVAYWI